MCRPIPALILILLLITTGCTSPAAHKNTPPVTTSVVEKTVLTPTPLSEPATIATTPSPPGTLTTTTLVTKTPVPTQPGLTEEELNTRIVDARNKLNNLIDSDVADTIVLHPDDAQGCDVKTSRELGYLIDATTGDSVFVKGNYGSISAEAFRNPMKKDHEYVIIHTHPRMWATCQGSGIVSLYTFSIGDLSAAAALDNQGYRIRYIIAISDKEYRISPKVPGNWKSPEEVRAAISRIEQRLETRFGYYDPVLDEDSYQVDSLMPLLAKELDYSYTANNHVLA